MPTPYEDLQRNYATHAAQALPPILEDLAATLGIEEVAQKEEIGAALARAFMAGADAGQSEVIAQTIEQGANVNVEQLRAPQDD